jgi:hypothetical protein
MAISEVVKRGVYLATICKSFDISYNINLLI